MHWLTIAGIVSGIILISVGLQVLPEAPDRPANLFVVIFGLAVVLVVLAALTGEVLLESKEVPAHRADAPVAPPGADAGGLVLSPPGKMPLHCTCECGVQAEAER